jgi:transcriptional regulator with XRE-family HTH domain
VFDQSGDKPLHILVGRRIRELREKAGRSREQLAEAVGVSVRAVVQWELGEREPGWFNVLALGEALGLDCRAFAEALSARAEPRGRGRPPKPKDVEPVPKRARGRPRKGG